MSTTPDAGSAGRTSAREPLAECTLEALKRIFEQAGFPGYRATQVMDWLYGKGVRDFAGMKNLPADVRSFLADRFDVVSSTLVAAHDSDDGAVRLEIRLEDGRLVEAVLMEVPRRVTMCLSSQVGCPLGCAFCATGQSGFERDLAPHEIVEQALHAAALPPRGARITHVVFMGMGEPALNLDAVFDAIRILNAPYAFHIGARRVTVSTLGNPRCIERIADFPFEVGLAVSLHAAADRLREKLVPAAPASIEETIEAAWRYFRKTGREVTFEYVLLAGVNDSTSDARQLASLLAGKRAFVNLIPYNEVPELPFKRPSSRRIAGFQRSLAARSIKAQVRRSIGRGVEAACGQLRLANAARRLK